MICKACQKQIPAGSQFCSNCGTRSDASKTGSQAPSATAVAGSGTGEGSGSGLKTASPTGRYEVLATLGQGGMGAIYKARDTKLNITVALKRLLPTIESQGKAVGRFLREAQAIAALNHLNIVRVYDIGEDESGHYISMEYIEGSNLREKIKKAGKLSIEQTVGIARQILQGLGYAHKRNIVHRDIKPANILMAEEEIPKIVDFGLAQMDTEVELSKTGYGMGTLSYMPPEQKVDAKSVDNRADIYAVGATMYEMCTGQSPSMVRESEIPSPLRTVILKALEPKRDERYPNAEEMVAALDQIGKRAAAQAVSVEAGGCPSCGAQNPPDVRFCQSCGGGLFEKCPKCQHENRFGLRFCGKCGVNLQQLKQADGFITKARELIERHRYIDASEECRRALGVVADHPEATQLLKEATEKHGRLQTHIATAKDLVKALKYEEAEVEIRQALELRPEDSGLVKGLAMIPIKIKERNLTSALQKAKTAFDSGRYEEAVSACQAALKLDGTHAAAKQLLEAAMKQGVRARTEAIKSALVSARAAFEQKNFDEARSQCQKILALEPQSEMAQKLLAEVDKAIEASRVKRFKDLLQEAQGHQKEGRLEMALSRLERAEQITPGTREVVQTMRAVKEGLTLRSMVHIPAGEFVFGEARQGLLRQRVKKNLPGFYMDKYPVTNADYKKFMDETRRPPPTHWLNGQVPAGKERHPVTNVTYFDAKSYADWCGKRLPTEEEWEKAARGTEGWLYPWGEEPDESRYNPGTDGTTPVNKYPRGASPYGVMDMLGNVWEWCEIPFATSAKTRLLRGDVGHSPSVTEHKKAVAKFCAPNIGFRCAKDEPR
ncbi:MAG: hypothetical protein FJ272_01660 [Planctomycetes bacterium]|nr:hypothetical protein [Planctomycetota bacterium]